MRASTWLRLAASGTRTDSVRFGVTIFGAAVATLIWLCAVTVASIGVFGNHTFYTPTLLNEPGLRPGVVAVMLAVTVPAMGLLAQGARLGAPARDRRIAAIRLAGATPRQAVAIGAGESGTGALLGTLIGLAVYFILRAALDNPDEFGRRSLPTDLLPPIPAIVLICVALPVLVTLASARLLRKVTTSPLGVTRQVRSRHAPRPWPGLLIGLGIASFVTYTWLDRHGHAPGRGFTYLMMDGALLSSCLGIALSAGWISYQTGRLLQRYGRRATTRLAAARMLTDPWLGSRTLGVLIVATLIGGGAAGAFGYFSANLSAEEAWNMTAAQLTGDQEYPLDGYHDTFYTNATKLLAIGIGLAVILAALGQLVAIGEAVVSRRRTYASLVATGVPRSVLVRAQLWQSLTPAVPTLIAAAAIGWVLIRVLWGGTVSSGGGSITDDGGPEIIVPSVDAHVQVPWGVLGITVGCAVGAVVLTTAISLVFLRSATSVEELRTV